MVMQLGMSPVIGQRQLGGQQQGGPFMGRDFMGQGAPPMSQVLKQQAWVDSQTRHHDSTRLKLADNEGQSDTFRHNHLFRLGSGP